MKVGDGKKKWIKGTPPNNLFFNTYWIWDGEYVILSSWIDSKWERKGHYFDPAKVTHYCELIKPDPPKEE